MFYNMKGSIIIAAIILIALGSIFANVSPLLTNYLVLKYRSPSCVSTENINNMAQVFSIAQTVLSFIGLVLTIIAFLLLAFSD